MTGSQKFIPIEDIRNNLVFLKDRSVSLVITASAVNFSLLFETEQISIIEAFAGLLNSLSFPIQVIIRSRRLDVSSYLTTLDKAQLHQTNPLLRQMTANFRKFVEGIIKENDVLDKQFYLCLNITPLEMGILSKKGEDKTKKALVVLTPRRDHLIRQLNRLGLKGRQLTTVELVKLFYDIYNQENIETVAPANVTESAIPSPQPQPPQVKQPAAAGFVPIYTDMPKAQPAPLPNLSRYSPPPLPLTVPFVVEELTDEHRP